MSRTRAVAGAVLFAMAAVIRSQSPPPGEGSPLLGLAIEFEKPPSAQIERQALAQIRSTGVSLFALSVSWSAAEPAREQYRVADVTRSARILRQSGATLHLDLPLVSGRSRDVPADLAGFAFDDPRLSIRLGRLLDALRPALLDVSTLSLGYEADAYFADKPEELKAFWRLFDGAVEFLHKLAPHLAVGVTTAAPAESVAPEVAARLHQKSPVLFYIYAPFARGKLFFHRAPDALEGDWKGLLGGAGGRPIAFPEVGYSSAAENGSSLAMQAEFVRRLRRFVSSSDGKKLLFARYVGWRDPSPQAYRVDPNASEVVRRRAAFLANRGLQGPGGEAKPAWREWVKGGMK